MTGDKPRRRWRHRLRRVERAFLRALMRLRPPRAVPARWLAVAGLLAAVGGLHLLSDKDIGLYSLFVLPCMLAGWSLGRVPGLVVAASAAAIALVSDLNVRDDPPVGGLVLDACIRSGLYALIAWGADAIGGLLQRLDELSRTDALTGLVNRREFVARGNDEVARARRSQRPFSVLFIDLDNFKAVNDRYGHAEGDALLRQVAASMTAQFRSVDVPARLGGDEFAVLLPETGGEGALQIGGKLHRAIKARFDRLDCGVSASIGVATFATAPASFDEAVKFADELMYSIKRTSKDAVVQRDFTPAAQPGPPLPAATP